MKTGTSLVLLVMLAGAAFAANGVDDYIQEPAKHWHDVDSDFMKTFHNPMEGVEMGLDIRLRQVYAENMFMEEDVWRYGRYRTRWSTKWSLSEDIDFNTRLVWEFRAWDEPDNQGLHTDLDQEVDLDEHIFDHMNIQIRNAFDMPLTLTIGRQDIILGTGWLVLDGTPADGSRTIYFDAVRGTYELSDATKLDVIYLQQYDNEAKWLKPFDHEDSRHVTNSQDEKGLIFYLTNKAGDQQREVYYIYKKDEPSEYSHAVSVGDAEIHTIGGRLSGKVDENWSYSTEVAKQWGKRDEQSMKGLGTNNTLTYAFNDDRQSKVFFMYEYLSGDDPTTASNEKFDTLWGDWPQSGRGGDLQSYVWAKEGAVGEVANLHRVGAGYSFKPADAWTMLTQYNLMWCDENTFGGTTRGAAPNATSYSTGGNFRGQMLTGLLTYQCCKNFRTQFLLDYFMPGSYYDNSSQDGAMFGRVNVEWTF